MEDCKCKPAKSYAERIIEYKEFVELVKSMRDAQKELDTCSIGDYAFRQHCAALLESGVDEYLKNMEI